MSRKVPYHPKHPTIPHYGRHSELKIAAADNAAADLNAAEKINHQFRGQPITVEQGREVIAVGASLTPAERRQLQATGKSFIP